MALHSISFVHMLFAIFCVSYLSATAYAVLDIEALLGVQESSLNDGDFVFNLLGSDPVIDASGGRQFVANRNNFRALQLSNGRNGGGGTQVLFRFAPCGFRTPHLHPRGTENFFVISGHVRANLLRESGGDLGQEVVVNDVKAGFAGFFPEAHIHFLQNFGCQEAVTLSIFDNSDPGVIDVAASLRFPRDTIQLTLGNNALSPSDALIEDVLIQSRNCLKRCGLLKN